MSPAGPAIGVLVVISLIVADFRAGKRAVGGAYLGNDKKTYGTSGIDYPV